MFSFFTKRSPFKVSDKIWKDEHPALRGIASEALQVILRNEIPVILSFFEDSKERVIQFLREQNINCFDLNPETANESFIDKSILCANANQIESIIRNSEKLRALKMHFLFESHHPLLAVEERVLSGLHELKGTTLFPFFLSLDKPLLQLFGPENLKAMMEKLGLREDEHLEHSMISKSILRARTKIDHSVKIEHKTTSEREWYAKNIRKQTL